MEVCCVVQARMGSSRLPGKALKLLGEMPLLAWTLRAVKNIPGDIHVLACDEDSYKDFLPLAKEAGFEIFPGEKEDVLKRFCGVIRKFNPRYVLRATGDNPFLFYESGSPSIKKIKKKGLDYFTFSSLPHGSGIEVFRAEALLEAEKLTNLPYDREHVGPAIYNHPENFNFLMEKAPLKWRKPELRTTVDTLEDYKLVLEKSRNLPSDFLKKEQFFLRRPPSSSLIVRAFR